MTDQIIAIEEHFTSPHLRKFITPREGNLQNMLDDMGALRLKLMDEAGIDIAVLSENNPAAQNLDAETSVIAARASNDYLFEQMQAQPARFSGFAALPLPNPIAAADELERAVSKLGLVGAMIMGTTHGQFVDDKRFWPVFERAALLDVPVYIHPSPILAPVREAYFKDYPQLSASPLGFGLETLTHTFRLIASGLFDRYPTLKIIVGHLGETAPFTLWRTDHILAELMKLPRSFSDYYKTHFWLSTSGAFSNSALQCAIAEMGVSRIMFAIDWPYIDNSLGTTWLKSAPISDTERAMIFAGNAKKLLRI